MELSLAKRTLANGLRVVVHRDSSDPLVAVHLVYHVGSSREEAGRSGFAHLFEHMLFQGSEHVPKGEHFARIQAAGGTLNGSTNQDLTRYWERLPSNELDLALWLESDRMGWLLGAMTQEKLDNQRDVVKNERRQSYDERPYGLKHETALAALYPEGHPYHHSTIGSMEDIDAATLEDVTRFFGRYYGPNNAVLVMVGDVEPEHAFARAEHWFGELASIAPVETPAPIPHQRMGAESGVTVVAEDDVAQPDLTMTWATVDRHHPDGAALNLLAEVLSANRASRIDRALSVDARLASHITIGHSALERAGRMSICLRPHEGVSLDRLRTEVDDIIEELAREGPRAEEIEARKARAEGGFLRALESLEARASILAEFEIMDGDAAELGRVMDRYLAVSAEDVRRVCERYLVRGERVGVITLPRGAAEPVELPLLGKTKREPATREVAPAAGPSPSFTLPEVWRTELGGGTPVAGTPEESLPMTLVRLGFAAGRFSDSPGGAGRAMMTAGMLQQGTRSLDVTAWTEALDRAGATLGVSCGDDDVMLSLRAPSHRLGDAVLVLRETVLQPRFGAEDFERSKAEHLMHLSTRGDRSNELADDAFRALIRGDQSALGRPRAGDAEAVEALTLEEVRAHWEDTLATAPARVVWVGAEEKGAALDHLAPFAGLVGGAPQRETQTPPRHFVSRGIYLRDRPGATQCELRVGHRGVAMDHTDFYPLQALNAILGGTFASRLNLNLREEKGITYGVRSGFSGGLTPGTFSIATAVDAEHCGVAVGEILAEVRGLLEGVKEEEVDFVRRTLSQGLLSTYASMGARAARLDNLLKYGFDEDYPGQRLAWLAEMTRAELDGLAARHIEPEELVVVVVGDAALLAPQLEALGEGEVRRIEAEN